MPDVPAEALDRLLAGELPASEQRRLAQAALTDPDLFELLMAAGIARTAAVADRDAKDESTPRARWTRSKGVLIALAAAASIVLAVALWSVRSARTPAVTENVATAPAVSPVTVPPVLLVARFSAATEPAFRAEATISRAPKQSGAIVSVHDGDVDVDLGALDGLTQGMELRAVRSGGARGSGRLTIVAVFRERSRGRLAADADVQSGDRVDVAPTVHVSAILEHVAARRAAGDHASAQTLAELAVTRSRTGDVASDMQRRALDQLASVLNELGAIRIEQRDYAAAERVLQAARSYAAGVTRMRVTNNLGALAAIRGDRGAAGTLYQEALSLAGDSADVAADRQAIEKNLAGLNTSR
jgi:hypothetical protein